jgi:uncharacterized membrane protein
MDLTRRIFALVPLLFATTMAMAAVPVDIHAAANIEACTPAKPCPVAIQSPGYGLTGSDYSFVTTISTGWVIWSWLSETVLAAQYWTCMPQCRRNYKQWPG